MSGMMKFPSCAGREALAARLCLPIDPLSQDWEWEVADTRRFQEWISVYQNEALSDDERFSLMEILIQCIEDMRQGDKLAEQLPEWQAVVTLLLKNCQLHASSIFYWSAFGHDDPDEQFRISVPMRQVWAKIEQSLA
jgi:hypothetical protein